MRSKEKITNYKAILKTALALGAFIATNNTVNAAESLNLSLNAGETLTYNQLSQFNQIIIKGNNDGNVIFNGTSGNQFFLNMNSGIVSFDNNAVTSVFPSKYWRVIVSGGEFDIANGTAETITFESIIGNPKIALDIDFSNDANNDKVFVDEPTKSTKFYIGSMSNFKNDLTTEEADIKISDAGVYTNKSVVGSNVEGSNYIYIFDESTPDDNGYVHVTRDTKGPLYEAIHNANTTPQTVTLSKTEQVYKNLGVLEENDLTIDGAGFGINGNNYAGIEVRDGKTLTIKNVGSVDANDNVLSSATNFMNYSNNYGSFLHINGGTTNIQNSIISNINNGINYTGSTSRGTSIYVENGTLNITNNTIFDNNSSYYDGGVIFNKGTINIDGAKFTNNIPNTYNSGTYTDNNAGGAIGNAGTLNIENAFFKTNSASEMGGAIANLNYGYLQSSPKLNIVSSDFEGNNAAYGGAIGNAASLEISSSNFISNNARSGGGGAIYNGGHSLILSDVKFSTNTATSQGGALYTFSNILNNAIYNSEFTSNNSSIGGAISNIGNLEINNTVFDANVASTIGGAIYNTGSLTINDSTFTNNTASTAGGAIYNYAGTLSINAVEDNTKFTNNSENSSGIYNAGGTIDLRATENKNIIINDTISGSIYTDMYSNSFVPVININKNIQIDNGSTFDYQYFKGNVVLNNDVIGNTVNLYDGILQLGSQANTVVGGTNNIPAPSISDLNIYGGTLSTANNSTSDNVIINSIAKDTVLNLAIDIDFLNINENGYSASDMITINGENKKIHITSFNAITEMNSDSAKIKISNSPVDILKYIYYRGSEKYTFQEALNSDTVIINKGVANGLNEIVKEASTNSDYDMKFNDNINESLGDLVPDKLTVNGSSNLNINGNNYAGLNVAEGKELIINNVGSVDNVTGDVIASINGFYNEKNGGFLNNQGTATLNNSVFYFNNAINGIGGVINNENKLVINDSIFKYNYASYGGVIHNNSNGNITINNSIFEENEAITGSAVYNQGNITINNTIFRNHLYQGVIFNATEDSIIKLFGTTFENNKPEMPFDDIIKNYGTLIIGGYDDNGTIKQSVFKNNKGIAANLINNYSDGKTYINNALFENNDFSHRSIVNGVKLSINDTTFVNNTVATGVLNILEEAEINNSIFSLNSSNSSGGVIYNAGVTTILNSSFEDNTATNSAGAIYNTGEITILDSTFKNNTATNNAGAIYNQGTLNINAHKLDVIFTENNANNISNDIYNKNIVNLHSKTDKNIIFDGQITGENGEINISGNNAGRITFNDAIAGNKINISSGIIELNNSSNSNINEVKITGGELSIANGIYESFEITTLDKRPKVALDINFETGDSDKIVGDFDRCNVINYWESYDGIPEGFEGIVYTFIPKGIFIGSLSNFENDLELGETAKIKISDRGLSTLKSVVGSNIENSEIVYIFEASTEEDGGWVNVSTAQKGKLYDAVHNNTEEPQVFTLSNAANTELVYKDLGLLEAKTLTIDGNNYSLNGNNYSGITVEENHELTIKNVGELDENKQVIASANEFLSYDKGGVVYLDGGKVNLENSVFYNNLSQEASVLYINSGTANLNSSSFINNSTLLHTLEYGKGTVITNNDTLNIDNAYFYKNIAQSGEGGAIYNNAKATIKNTQFVSNVASYGGAIYNNGKDSLLISENNIYSNGTSFVYASAIYNAGTANITNDTYSNNFTHGLAAIYNTGTITVTDSNFTSNYGGAIYNTGNATIYAINDNVVFEKNRNNSSYNDIYNLSELNLNAAADKVISFTGTIEGNSTTPSGNITINQNSTNTGKIVFNRDVKDQLNVNFYNGTLQLGSIGENGSANTKAPEISNLNIYGGTLSLANGISDENFEIKYLEDDTTLNLILDIDFAIKDGDISKSDSINILSGNNVIDILDFNVISDMVGNSAQIKISDNPFSFTEKVLEKGLFEYTFFSSNTGIIDINKKLLYSLYDAVNDTKSEVTYSLLAQDDVSEDLGSIKATKLTITGDGNHSINGNGHEGITVDDGKTLIVENVGSLNDDKTVKTSINGFKNVGGNGSFASVVEGGTLKIQNSVFANNSVEFDPTSSEANGYGGVIDNLGGTVNITNSTFDANSAELGGVIANDGTASISNSTFTNNTATSGGVVNNGENITITGSTFDSNSAEYGGAIYNNYDATLVVNGGVEFKNNVAETAGGAIYNEGTLVLNATSGNILFEGNTASGAFEALYNASGVVNIYSQNDNSVRFDDGINGDGVGNININNSITADDGTVTAYNGTVIFNNNVYGNNVNLYNGTLQLGSKADTTIEGSVDIAAPTIENLNIYGGTLNLENNFTSDNISIKSIANDVVLNLALDIDFQDTASGYSASDMITIDDTSPSKTIKITSLNVKSEMNTNSATIKISDKAVDVLENAIYTTTEKFIFNEASNTLTITINKAASSGLAEALKDPNATIYDMNANDIITEDLGALASDKLEINGSDEFSIYGKDFAGVSVPEGKELIVNDAGSFDETTGAIKTSIGGFDSKDNNGGFVNNNGTLTITNTILNDNNAANGGAISNSGTTTITNSSLLNNTATTDGGAIFNENILNIVANNGKTEFTGNSANGTSNAIHNTGTVNMTAAEKTDIILINDGISGNNGIININKTIENEGVSTSSIGNVVLNNNVTGNTVNLYNGTLQLGSKADTSSTNIPAPTIENLNIYGGTLDIANNIATDNVSMSLINTDTLNLILDIDFANIDSEGFSASDMVNITADATPIINFAEINILSDLENATGKIKISDNPVNTLRQVFHNGLDKYIFNASTSGIIDIDKTYSQGLYDAIHDADAVVTYKLLDNDDIMKDLGDLEAKSLTIEGQGQYNINGNNNVGLVAGEDKEVIINSVGSLDENGNITSSINGFATDTLDGAFINNSGKLNVKDSIFKNNTAVNGGAISNSGFANIEKAQFVENKAAANGGAITNNKLLSISNTKFADNEATTNGGAIFNGTDGVLNIRENVTFENNSANGIKNDIHNDGSINLLASTVFTGGITGTGALNIEKNVTADFSKSSLNQNTVRVTENSLLNIDNETNENIANLVIAENTVANILVDFNDKIETTSAQNGQLNLKSIDFKGISAGDKNTLTTTLGENIIFGENTQLLNKDDAINYFAYNKNGNEIELIANQISLNQAINETENNKVSVYELKQDETIDVGNEIHSNGEGSKFKIVGSNTSIKEGSIIVEKDATLKTVDTNIKNSVTAGNDAAKGAITVQAGGEVNLIAENHDITIINTDNKVALFLESEADKGSTANLVAKDGKKITINEDILSDNKANVVNFNGGTIEFNGLFDPVTANVNSGTLIRNGYDDDISYNLNGGTLKYSNDKYIYNSEHHNGTTYALNDINFNGGALDLMNFGVNTVKLDALTVSKNSNLYVDADLDKGTMDKLTANSIQVIEDAKLNVAGINILKDTFKPETSINFTEDEKLKKAVKYTGKQGIGTAYSPIYKYDVAYDSATGNFNFKKKTHEFNPVVNVAPVAQQMAFLNQINSYEEAFANMDMIMLMPRYERIALKHKNKYAYGDMHLGQDPLEANVLVAYNENIIPEEMNGAWFKPYVTMEKVDLDNGPKVNNTAYGGLVGTDSGIIELKNGWDAVYSLYAGYNGSMQDFRGIDITQNGGMIGATSVFYKGNFFTGLTANVGASHANASTAYGHEDFAMLATGIASKTGYNFEFFNGKFIMQPSWLMSYSFVNTFDHTNSAGLSIESDPLHAMQISPAIKFVGNLKNGWQPYASFNLVWNLIDETDFKANDVSLPDLSVDPYVQYTVGVQKRWGERCTGSLQTTLRHGGRDGISFSANFRYALGDEPNKSASNNRIQTIENRRVINISANRL